MKKVIIVSILVFLVISLSSIKDTFSFYQDKVEKKGIFDVASWIIKVNDSDITLSDTKEFSINDVILDIPDSSVDGLKVSDEKFAPGTKGYFLITLDLSEVDTLIDYSLVVDTSNFVNNNILISSVEFNDEQIEIEDGKYSSSTNKLYDNVLIKVNFEWVLDGEDEDIGIDSNSELIIPVSLDIVQRIE